MQRLLRLLADPTRVRILAALEDEDLAVTEIAQVLGTSQSCTSNHLRLLREGDALVARREGSWTFYRSALSAPHPGAPLWQAVRRGLEGSRTWRADRRRRRAGLERRRRRSRVHVARGGQGSGRFESGSLGEEVLAALVPAGWTAVDAGCGDGLLTERLAERFGRVVAVDHSPTRLARARQRVRSPNVEFQQGEIDDLPLPDATADVVLLSMVLHHAPEIGAALREALRVLRPGGRVLVADLVPHGEESMRSTMGDLRLGLEPEALLEGLREAGFVDSRVFAVRDRLVVGTGPRLSLFLTVARRPASGGPPPEGLSAPTRTQTQASRTRRTR
ncbi:MAG: ArsR/SmtB family transcription factor [Planctomycetota bacterium]